MPPASSAPARFHSLDALRGLAALCVVFWHWQHFFFEGAAPSAAFRPEDQPLFGIFFLLYRRGILAVDLFFALSGFIFFWLYASAIAERKVSAFEFAVLRFSRLYPLHLLTLLLVAAGQWNFTRMSGGPFIYAENDLRHFVLNLALASSVGLERGFSFNAPAWSVSVEAFLYAVFFLVCRFLRPRLIVVLGLALLGFLVLPSVYPPIARGISSFFLGGIVYRIYLAAAASKHARTISGTLAALALGLWAATLVVSYRQMLLAPLLERFSADFPTAILFPVTILALALVETHLGVGFSRLAFLGDLSYSSYLWHFPLQLLFATVARTAGVGASAFQSPLALLLFLAILIPLSLASHRFLEVPAQRFLRRAWLAAPSKQKPSTVSSEAGGAHGT